MIVWGAVMAAAAGQVMDAEERSALLDAARIPVSETLGKPPVFAVRQLNRQDDWAFLFADMQQQGGAPYDYSGTAKAEAARRGLVSRAYAALLRRDAQGWRVVECAIGPTDVAWSGWAEKYGLPASLFVLEG